MNLGLTTQQYAANFPNAYKPWSNWSKGLIDPANVPDELIQSWTATKVNGYGYDSARKCFCWGFRPGSPSAQIQVMGAKWGNAMAQTPWYICPDSAGVCAACRPGAAPGATATSAPPKEILTPETASGEQNWGVNVGWLLAGAVIAGGGYFAYTKLKKGKK